MTGSGKVIAAVLCLLLLPSCTTRHIFFVGEPVRAGSAEVAHADSFAVVEKSQDLECPSNSLVEVRVKRDLLNSLLGVLTLGIYQSTHIEYFCGKVPDDDVPVLGEVDG
jgi:hypothetical protein